MSRTPKPTFSLELLFQKGFLLFAGVVRLVRLLLANSTALAFRVFDPCLQLLQNKFIKQASFLRGWPHLCFKLPLKYCLLKMRLNGGELDQVWSQRTFQVSLGAGWQSWQRFLLLLQTPSTAGSGVQHRNQAESPAAAQGRWHFCTTAAALGSLKASHHSAATSLLPQHIPSAQQKLGLNAGNSSWENQNPNHSWMFQPVSRWNAARSFESIQTRYILKPSRYQWVLYNCYPSRLK